MGDKLAVKISKAKDSNAIVAKEAHNARLYDTPNSHCKNDKEREYLNEYHGASPGTLLETVNQFVEEKNKELKSIGKRKIRKDANVVFEVIVTSGPNFFKNHDDTKFFNDVDDFFLSHFGNDCIAAKYIHRDETTPHAHYMIYPTVELEKGGINFNHYFGKRWKCSEFQQQIYDYMTKEKGYEFDERTLKKDTVEKYADNLEWSKRVSESKDAVSLMDEQTKADYSIKGVMAEDTENRLTRRIKTLREEKEALQERITYLEEDNEINMKIINDSAEYKNKYYSLKKGVAKKFYNKDSKEIESELQELEALGGYTEKKIENHTFDNVNFEELEADYFAELEADL